MAILSLEYFKQTEFSFIIDFLIILHKSSITYIIIDLNNIILSCPRIRYQNVIRFVTPKVYRNFFHPQTTNSFEFKYEASINLAIAHHCTCKNVFCSFWLFHDTFYFILHSNITDTTCIAIDCHTNTAARRYAYKKYSFILNQN